MRITESMRLSAANDARTAIAARLTVVSKQAATGQRVAAPSDDPVAYRQVSAARATLARFDARTQVLGRASGDLDLAESTLASAGDLLDRARAIAVEGANGTLSAADRRNAASEVTSLRQQLVGLANTKGSAGYLFGGSQTAKPPFDPNGVFGGDDRELGVEVADGVVARANASGAHAFTAAGGRDVFADLDALVQALNANDPAATHGLIDPIAASGSQLVAARVATGLSSEKLKSATDVIASARTAVETARSVAGDADAPTTYADLVATQTAFERSLDVTKRILALPSLADR